MRHISDSTTERSPAALYRDGVQISRATLPVTFPVPGGVAGAVAATERALALRTRWVLGG